MRFKVGNKVRVVRPYSGGEFYDGDIVEIAQIECEEDGNDCYGAVSPHDNQVWFLNEDEVTSVTNADRIRSMNDEELAEFLSNYHNDDVAINEICHAGLCLDDEDCIGCTLRWLQQLAKEG